MGSEKEREKRKRKKVRERLCKRYHHHVDSCGIPLVILHPGIGVRVPEHSSGDATSIESKSCIHTCIPITLCGMLQALASSPSDCHDG